MRNEWEWLESMIKEYVEILGQKYGDGNFAVVVITLTYEDNGDVKGVACGHGSKQLRECADHCKVLLGKVFAYEKALSIIAPWRELKRRRGGT